MNMQTPRWIWTDTEHENQVCCFAKTVSLPAQVRDITLRLCADTRYAVYWNGRELGRGPIRSGADARYYDTYVLDAVAVPGDNELCIRVWHYGLSTYQSIASSPGVWFCVQDAQTVWAVSDSTVKAAEDTGHVRDTVKRNVNLGFMEHQNAAAFSQTWLTNAAVTRDWAAALPVAFTGALLARPLPPFHTRTVYPQRVVAVREVTDGCKQISVNTREAFFPKRRDANETIFCGFLGCVLDSPCAQKGEIAFPNRTWNGLSGDFTLAGTRYEVTNEKRSVSVSLQPGRQLFWMQLSGKYDDLYCHLEFNFPQQPQIASTPYGPGFFVLGPTDFMVSAVDGVGRVYGGLQEFERFETFSPQHTEIFASVRCEADLARLSSQLHAVPQRCVTEGEYLLSVTRRQNTVQTFPVQNYSALLYSNQDFTEISVPPDGCLAQIVLDFEDLYVGSFSFTVDAQAGTGIDLYCYENNYGGKPDFTVGLNNALRYECAQGMQTYHALSRMGCRYAVLTLRHQHAPVRLYQICLQHSTYPASGNGRFTCSDEQLNRIWAMAKNTHLLCMEDTFTDCPTYEQAFWIGDAQISGAVNAWLCGAYPLMRHCLEIAATAACNTPMFNALTPTDWNTSIPMWALNWVLSVEQYVRYTGDSAVAQALYPKIAALLRYFTRFITPEGAFVIQAWNMLDWAAMDIHNHGLVTGQQGLLAYCLRYAAQLAQAQKDWEMQRAFLAESAKLLCYLNACLWDDVRGAFVDGWSPKYGLSKTISTQTHALLCLFDAISDAEKRSRAQELLRCPPEGCLTAGSPFILYYQYECWAKQGAAAQIIQDIRKRWGEMARYDCTTCWEVFPGFYENSRTRSYCHSWSSLPAYFFPQYLLGIAIDVDGFNRIAVHLPEIPELTWCEGSVPTPHGVIEAAWSREASEAVFRLRVPQSIEVKWHGPGVCRFTVERYYSNLTK